MGMCKEIERYPDHSHSERVPDWLTLYVFLGLGDMAFTLLAFQMGAIEANPFLRHLQGAGLFEFTKISLTLLVLCVSYRLRHRPLIHNVMGFANVGMVTLNVYHVTLLALVFILGY